MDRVHQIWAEFLAPDASMPVNIDSKSYEVTKRNMEKPDRWTFEAAGVSHDVDTLTRLFIAVDVDERDCRGTMLVTNAKIFYL